MVGKLVNSRNERGMALAVAIFALVIVGALVAGALFAGTQEQRVGESSRRLQQSFGIAELGVNTVVRSWDPNVYNVRGQYPTDSLAVPNALVVGTTPRNTGSFGGYVYRLNDNLYLVDVTGHDTVSGRTGFGGGAGRARQRLGLLARIRPLKVDIQASLTTGASTGLAGNGSVSGFDNVPPAWSACTAGGSVAGIRTDAGNTVTYPPGAVTGTPPVVVDATVNDSTFSQFGDVSYAQLASRANITVPAQNFSNGGIAPVVTGGVCNKTSPYNWGDGLDPTAPCGSYYPIIHITGTGTSKLQGDQGQGILLIDGSLTVTSSFQFFGIVIIQGSLSTSGGGTSDAHFYGTVMVHDSTSISDNSISGHANLLYSSCAIIRALNTTGIVAPMRARGWVQLF
jgi:hypothetical protein